MKNRITILLMELIMGLCVLGFVAVPAHSQSIAPLSSFVINYNPVPIAAGQELRAYVYNVTGESGPYAPGACSAIINFYDALGNLTKTEAFSSIAAGHFVSVALAGPRLTPGAITGFQEVQGRVAISLVVPSDGDFPPDPCRTSLAVIDMLTGRATIVEGAAPHSQEPLPSIVGTP